MKGAQRNTEILRVARARVMRGAERSRENKEMDVINNKWTQTERNYINT